MKGKKPTVAQRNALKKKVKDKWEDYLFLKEKTTEIHSDSNHLSKDGVKEKWYVFKHKDTGEEITVRAKR